MRRSPGDNGRVLPVSVSSTIDSPRDRVFEYLSDIATYPEFTDHFLRDFRLERLESRGVGAAARFRVSTSLASLPLAAPLFSAWAEAVFSELDPPHRIVIDVTAGRLGRIKAQAVIALTPHDHHMTRVTLSLSADSPRLIDRLRDSLGGRLWLKRQCRKALHRLRLVLEEGEPRAHAVRVAPG
jgi:uncharacterized protein YndB with AHSA1/START domain